MMGEILKPIVGLLTPKSWNHLKLGVAMIMTVELRRELFLAAKANLDEAHLKRFHELLAGSYKDDPEALTGYIWDCLEDMSDDEYNKHRGEQ